MIDRTQIETVGMVTMQNRNDLHLAVFDCRAVGFVEAHGCRTSYSQIASISFKASILALD